MTKLLVDSDISQLEVTIFTYYWWSSTVIACFLAQKNIPFRNDVLCSFFRMQYKIIVSSYRMKMQFQIAIWRHALYVVKFKRFKWMV